MLYNPCRQYYGLGCESFSHDGEDEDSEDSETSGDWVYNGNGLSVVWIVEEGWDEEKGKPHGVSEENHELLVESHLHVCQGSEELVESNHEGSNPKWDLATAESILRETHWHCIWI